MKRLLALLLLASALLNVCLLLRRMPAAPPPRVIVRELQVPAPATAPESHAPQPLIRPDQTPRGRRHEEQGPVDPLPARGRRLPSVILAAHPGFAAPGEPITVTITVAGGQGDPNDWLGLYETGADDRNFLTWQRAGTGNTLTFTAPDEDGVYEFRYFPGGDYTRLGASNAVCVVASLQTAPVSVSLTAFVFTSDGKRMIKVDWHVLSGTHTPRDWIGLYVAGGKNRTYVAWKYVERPSGSLVLEAPETTGTYEVRYLPDNGYRSVAVSAPVVIYP
jgi:hypothetical protein